MSAAEGRGSHRRGAESRAGWLVRWCRSQRLTRNRGEEGFVLDLVRSDLFLEAQELRSGECTRVILIC